MKSRRKIASLFLTLFVLVLALGALSSCDADVYTVNFDSNGGSRVESTTVVSGEKLTPPAAPSKENYVFSGWYTENGIWDFETAVTGDMTLVAMWKKSADADVVSIVFDSNGGSAVETVKVERGATIGAPAAPTRAGYIFTGWTSNGKAFDFTRALSNSATLTAGWEIIEYTVSYDLAGGSNAKDNPARFTVESETATILEPTKAGYTFTGWTFEGQETPVKELQLAKGSVGNKSYTANWQLNTYTLAWDLNGGEISTTPATSYNVTSAAISVPNPTKTDYEFLGWTSAQGAVPVKNLIIPTGTVGDISYTANWAPVQYTITYNLAGGTNNSANPTAYSHESAFALGEPTRTGYTFTGWTFEGQEAPTKDVAVAAGTRGEKSYTANWEIITYTITYNQNGGTSYTGTLTSTFTVEDLPIYPESLYIESENKSFTAWCSDEALTSPVSVINTCENITLYASFAPATEGLVIQSGVVIGYTGTDTTVYIPEYFNGTRVVAIADGAFKNNETVNAVYIPSGALQIGTEAFAGCTALENVYIKATAALVSIESNAFTGCTALKSIEIPANVISIGSNAFMSCLKLENVSFAYGSRLSTIGKSVFDSCLSLKSVSFPATLTTVSEKAFYNNQSLEAVYFADGALVSYIEKEAFAGCISLAEIRIPASTIKIRRYAFQGAACLSSLTFEDGSSLVEIEQNAFYGCDSLVTLAMPDSLVEIGDSAFAFSDKIESLTFGENSKLALIGSSAFYNCGSLKTVVLASELKEIKSSAFYNCQNLETLVLGDSVEMIARDAFFNTNKVKELVLPSSLKTLEKDAFRGCNSLESLTVAHADATLRAAFSGALPATIKTLDITSGTTIELGAFANCKSIETITIPFLGTKGNGQLAALFGGSAPSTIKTVIVRGSNSIPQHAFEGCDSIEVLILSPDIISFSASALEGLVNLKYLEISLIQEAGSTSGKTLSALFGGSVPKSLETVSVKVGGGIETPELSVEAFEGAPIKTVILDKEIVSLGSFSFSEMKELEAVVIPADSKLTTVGEGAFAYTEKLKELTFTNPELTLKVGVFAYSKIEKLNFAQNALTSFEEAVFLEATALREFDTRTAGITVIPAGTFYGCTALENVIIADRIKAIGESAFEGCEKLTAVTFGEDSEITAIASNAFRRSGLTRFTVPDALVAIESGVFSNCKNLKTVVFTEATLVNTIKTSAFEGSGIIEFTVPKGIMEIQAYAFASTASLKSVTFAEDSALIKLEHNAFDSSAIESIAIPDGIEIIANETFRSCKALTTVTFGEASQLAAIMPGAFNSCMKLTAIAIPAGVNIIGNNAFANCFSLATVSFAENAILATIDQQAFYNCDALTKINIPASVMMIGEKAFYSCSALTEVVFAQASLLEEIDSYVFAGSEALVKINIPDSVKTIRDHAFANCTALTTIEIGANSTLEAIEDSAFRGCKALTSFVLPTSIQSLGSSAFAGCSELTSFVMSILTENVGDTVFASCPKLVITINYSDDADNGRTPDSWNATWNIDANTVVWVDTTPAA